MEHIVSVGMDVVTLKQLDDLRRAHPNVPSRVQVIKNLIWEAHGKIAAKAELPMKTTMQANQLSDLSAMPTA